LLSGKRETDKQTNKQQNKNMKNKTMLNVTNAKVMTPPFEGWGNHSISPFSDLFRCDEMIFPEPIKDGKVTLNGQTFSVIYDKVDNADECELPAEIVIK
jgi:hypothetical protein